MTTDSISLEFLATQAKQNMEELRHVRQELANVTRLVTATYDMSRRVERNQHELRSDIELTIKIEIGGSFSHMQTTLDNALARIENRMSILEARF